MTTTRLEWQRAKRNSVGGRYWLSQCGRYMVSAAECVYGVPLDPVIWTAWYQVVVYDRLKRLPYFKKLSRHRSRKAALRAANQHARRSER